MELELQASLLQARLGVAHRVPGAAVPEHHGAPAILTLGDNAFKAAILHGMILDLHCQSLNRGVQVRPFGHCPTFEDPVEFQTKIVVQTRGVMLLHDKGKLRVPHHSAATRLRRPSEFTF